jgi:hypothetical protein
MNVRRGIGSALRWGAGAAGLAAGAYAACVAVAWCRFGRTKHPPGNSDPDPLLDRFMPVYEVRGLHHIRVGAPAGVTLAAAREMPLFRLPLVRAIFKARELILGAAPDDRPRPHGLLCEAQALGWGVLGEIPGREIVVGAVTRPWEANVVFHALAPGEFPAFDKPGWVKIAWTLRAEPIGRGECVFSTETRVASTDAEARARFRRYWSFFSPGMALIRWLSLRPLKKEAERRARSAGAAEQADDRAEDF